MEKSEDLQNRIKARWGMVSKQDDSIAPPLNAELEDLRQRLIEKSAQDVFHTLRQTTVEYAAKFWMIRDAYNTDSDVHDAICKSHNFIYAQSLYDLRSAEARTGSRGMIDINAAFGDTDLDLLCSPDFAESAKDHLYTRYDARENLNINIRRLIANHLDRHHETAEDWVANSTHEILAVLNHHRNGAQATFLIDNAKNYAMYAIQKPEKAKAMEQGLRSQALQFVMEMPHIRDMGKFIARINEQTYAHPKAKQTSQAGQSGVLSLFGRAPE